MWKAMSKLVDIVVSELEVACSEYPYSSIGEWFDNDERRIIAECARYFKAHPDQLERW